MVDALINLHALIHGCPHSTHSKGAKHVSIPRRNFRGFKNSTTNISINLTDGWGILLAISTRYKSHANDLHTPYHTVTMHIPLHCTWDGSIIVLGVGFKALLFYNSI